MKLALSLLLAPSTLAFTSNQQARSSVSLSETKADLESLSGKLNPVIKYFDPLNLGAAEFWGQSNEATIGFLRHSEIKHGRIAMAGFVGYCVQSNFNFPWPMTMDGQPFPSPDLGPEAQWDALPEAAKWQIMLFIGFLEVYSELSPVSTHYMRGGQPGKFPTFDAFRDTIHPMPFNLFDPFMLSSKASAEKKEKGLVAEINNGRLAMLGLFGFLSEDKLAGSVPALKDIALPYSGESMAPFSESIFPF